MLKRNKNIVVAGCKYHPSIAIGKFQYMRDKKWGKVPINRFPYKIDINKFLEYTKGQLVLIPKSLSNKE